MIAHDVPHTIVLADGAELLVHDGPTEGPRWRRTCEAPLVAVGVTAGAVIGLDRDGRATWYEHDRDAVRASADAGEEVRAGAITPGGHVLAATRRGVVVLTPDGRGPELAWPGACVVAGAPDGRILVADEAGKIGELDAGGALRHQAQLDEPAVAAAWNVQGFWVVASARKLVRLADGALHHLTSAPADMPVRAVACAPDGASIAIVLGDSLALVMSWPARDTTGQLRYLERRVVGLNFGPDPWLVVALDGGDGNKLHLRTGDLHRTDTHPGRPHRRWLVQVSVDPPAEAKAPPAAAARAPASPQPAAFSPPAADRATSAGSDVKTILVVLGATLAVIALIAWAAL